MEMLMYKLLYTTSSLIGNVYLFSVEGIVDKVLYAIKYVIGLAGYCLTIGICKLVNLLYSFFEVFGGLEKIKYKDESKYLINTFFEQSFISEAYSFMAVLSIVLMFAFLLAAIITKLFDVNEKNKQSYSQIIISAGKAILVILLMNVIMTVSLSITNILMQSINYIFDASGQNDQFQGRTFTDQEFATMNEIFETIGNYSLNPSYNSRYNINSCFNDIRADMLYLQQQGVFNYDYTASTAVASGGLANTWQNVLQEIARAADLRADVKMDVYHEKLTTAITNAMDILKNNKNFRPVQMVKGLSYIENTCDLDVLLFLTGTSKAANNEIYNINPSVGDAVRGPFYSGAKSIYSLSDVNGSFEIALGGINYLIIILMALLMGWQLVACILICTTRIFNLLLLYIIAPPFAATIPLDDGARFKQWTQAFVVQCVNVFGTVIVMRLVVMYIPIILSSELVLFNNGFLNMCGKTVLIYAGIVAATKGADLFAGILTGNGASASASAGNVAGNINAMGTYFAGRAVKGALGFASDATGLTALGDKIKERYDSFKKYGGIFGKLTGAEARDKARKLADEANKNGGGSGGGGDDKDSDKNKKESKPEKTSSASDKKESTSSKSKASDSDKSDSKPAKSSTAQATQKVAAKPPVTNNAKRAPQSKSQYSAATVDHLFGPGASQTLAGKASVSQSQSEPEPQPQKEYSAETIDNLFGPGASEHYAAQLHPQTPSQAPTQNQYSAKTIDNLFGPGASASMSTHTNKNNEKGNKKDK